MGYAVRDDRPGVGERYGSAINASSLDLQVGKDGALDRVCEMAYARIALDHGDAEKRLAGELAPLLWRAAYGRDDAAVVLACTRFTELLMLRPYFREIELVDAGIARRFAEAVLDEWLRLRCQDCGGSCWQEVLSNGKRVRPTGRARNALKAICQACRGTGRPRPSAKLRMRVLGSESRKISMQEYAGLWHRQFVLALILVREIATSPRDHLRRKREEV